MCLTTKQKWPKIAWKPITTYKVVYSPNNYPSLLTIFQCFPIQIGKTYKETLRNIFESRKKLSASYEMHFGLHSDIKEDQSRAIAKCYKYYGTIVVECTIPRFNLCWIGDNNDIVSNKLKYVKIL